MALTATEPLAIGFYIAVIAAIVAMILVVRSGDDIEVAPVIGFLAFMLTWFVAMIFL